MKLRLVSLIEAVFQATEDYEIQYLAEKHGLSAEQVMKLIARVGNDREKIEAAARQLSKAG